MKAVNALSPVNSTVTKLAAHEVDTILRQRRKYRLQRACYPCRQRKVRCDYQIPCKTCTERAHEELCAYEPSSKSVRNGSCQGQDASIGTRAQDQEIVKDTCEYLTQKLKLLENSVQDLKQACSTLTATFGLSLESDHQKIAPLMESNPSKQELDSGDIYKRNILTGEDVHFGSNSVLATAAALSAGSNDFFPNHTLLEGTTLPLLGLASASVTYPFVDLWVMTHGPLARIQELCRLIPTHTETLNLFQYYQNIAHVLYPAVVDLDEFEVQLMQFLAQRTSDTSSGQQNSLRESDVYGKSLNWLALFFAILAAGCQWQDIPSKLRQSAAQIFGKLEPIIMT